MTNTELTQERKRAGTIASSPNTLVVLFCTFIACWYSISAVAAKPSCPGHPSCKDDGGGGNADTTAPAAVNDLTVEATIRALTLRFTATGDDGTSGQAALYDVRYLEGACAEPPDVPSWTDFAPRTLVTVPEAPGTPDYFNIRPLEADTAYCVGISVVDEAGNTSDYVTADARTQAGWQVSVVADQQLLHSLQVNTSIDPTSDAVIVWTNLRESFTVAQPGFELVENLVGNPDDITDHRYLRTAHSAEGDFAVALSGKLKIPNGSKPRRVWSYVLAQQVSAGGWWFDTIASGDIEAGGVEQGSSDVTYVLDADGSTWNPVVVYAAISDSSRTSKRSAVMLAERDTSSPPTEVFSCDTQEGNLLISPFMDFDLVTKTDGLLALAVVTQGRVILAEELEEADGGGWSFRHSVALDTSPWRGPRNARLAFDSAGDPVVAVTVSTEISGRDVVLLGDSNFSSPVYKAALACSAPMSEPTLPVVIDPSTEIDRSYAWALVAGLSVGPDDSIYIASSRSEGNYKTSEIRLLYQCNGTGEWSVEAIDRVHRWSINGSPLAPNGDLMIAYGWGYFAREGGGQYTTQPLDTVILAQRTGTPCDS